MEFKYIHVGSALDQGGDLGGDQGGPTHTCTGRDRLL